MSDALNLELDCDTLSNTIHINLTITEAYRCITLIYLIMYSDPEHIIIAQILHFIIEHIVRALCKMRNRIR